MTQWHPGVQVIVPSGHAKLEGMLEWPEEAEGVVVLAECGAGGRPPRGELVGRELRVGGLATLLIDLLAHDGRETRETRFDVGLLTTRLAEAVRYLKLHPGTASLPVGLFGVDTGAAAALRVAAEMPERIRAVVAGGGRPDLAGADALARVRAPTLLIVGARDAAAMDLNEVACARLVCEKRLATVAGATHLFEEPGALKEVSRLAAAWFARHLQTGGVPLH
jgi:pimeloyl-ACP methyl ester carboxylesterase